MKEIWKDIPEYEGRYKVSNKGRIKSLLRYVPTSAGQIKRIPEKILGRSKVSYGVAVLCKNGVVSYKRWSRVVADSFVPNPSNLDQVNHIDRNKTNDRADNLEWVSHRENQCHRFSTDKNLTSKHRGVYWKTRDRKWVAQITVDKKQIELGYYTNELDAANAYQMALKNYNIVNRYA